MKVHARVTGWGKCLPLKVVTNFDLEKIIDTTDEWIRGRTGIAERRVASDDETASTLATQAALDALQRAQVSPEDIDLIVVATVTPDQFFPPCASLVQHAIGAKKAAAFDLNAVCSGFVYALAVGCQFIFSGTYRNVLVVGSDVFSRAIDWSDRGTCILFGDGAGALLIQATTEETGFMSFSLGSDGSGADLLYMDGYFGKPGQKPVDGVLAMKMNGTEVFKFAVKIMDQVIKDALDKAGLKTSDISMLIPHQANERIITSAARSMKLPKEKVFMNIDRYGNTSAGSIPIAVCEAAEEGLLNEGDNVVLVGFGGGLTWGATVLKWGIGTGKPERVFMGVAAGELGE